MLGLRVPDATNAVKVEGGGQRGTEHMACPDEEENHTDDNDDLSS